jgi:type II secretory pathway component PulM
MAGSRGSWSWDVSGFEPPQPATTTAAASAPTAMPRAPPTAMVLRPSAGAGAVPVADRLDQLADSVQVLVSPLEFWFGNG